ncbi:serine hydrolase domain-containing protein [Solibacillus daqui]|uniref:serine hydrolase domain-containing protein n=1 Tax=Solibacillus daqui TaxID=2912187 RepID=UPI00236593C1|nr:serine hydrolase domain-containing protein [Solibacillus daqui]
MRKITLMVLVLVLSFVSAASAKEGIITPSGIPYAELRDRVDEYATNYIGRTTAGANVLIIKDGEIFMNTSYGYADIENQIKVTQDTVFEWGSVTKLLVWTSVMQLVEQGKLDLDEDIRAYLPDDFLTKLQYDTPITMLNLMHHNAGWEEKFTDLFYMSAADVKSLKEMLHITEPYQIHEPGDVVAYSNYGVALAGFIVERIAAEPFYDYVKEHIFSVLEMKDTTIHPTQKDNPDVASNREAVYGYSVNGDNEFSISKNGRVFIGLYPAGSAMGTIADMAKFMVALMPVDGVNSPLFKSNSTLDEMLTTSDFYGDGFPRNAHGFWEGLYTVNVLEHAGNTDSFSSNFTFSKDEQLGVIIMTNQMGEFGLSYGLPTLVYGEYSVADGKQAFPNTQELEGSYSMARQPYKGFTKLYGALSIGNIEATDRNNFNAYGMTFEQIAPYLYKSTNEFNLYLHVTLNDSKVEKISMPTSDILPISPSAKAFNMVSTLAVAFSVLYTLIALLIILIKSIKNRKQEVQFTVMKKWEILLLLAGIVPVMNLIILAYRTLNYASYSTLNIHFLVNYAYILVVVICLVALFVQWKKTTKTHGQKIGYVLSCVSALLMVVLVFGWELYY